MAIGVLHSINLRLPGMVYAYAKRSPVFRGQAEGFDAASSRAARSWSPAPCGRRCAGPGTTGTRRLRGAARRVEAECEVPFLSHTPLGPLQHQRVHRVVVAPDCATVVLPDGVRTQI
jgi:hypothetical protein